MTTNETNANDLDASDILDTLVIEKNERRGSGYGAVNGTWVQGTMAGHRFDALVFRDHATNPDYEIGDSRISKLWLQRIADRATVYNWDRGADVQPATTLAGQIVDLLAAGLAELIYSE